MLTLLYEHRFLHHQTKRKWDQEGWDPDGCDERREESPKAPSVELFVERNLPCLMPFWREALPGAGERHSTRDKGHEEGGSAYANAGSSLGSAPGYSRASTPQKTRICLLYCFVLSPLTLLGAVPHHHLTLSVKELTYSSN